MNERDTSHVQQRSGSPVNGNPDAAIPSSSLSHATELGGSPSRWSGGDIAATLAPNASPAQTARLWYPVVVTIAQGATVNIDAGTTVERWYVTQTSGASSSVFALPNGAGVGLPLFGSGVTLHLPVTTPVISVQNTGTGSVTIAAIAIAGYDPIEGLGYITASDATGGGSGGNVTITGPVDGSGFVEVAIQSQPGVQGTAASGTVPVGNPVWIAGSDGTDIRALLTDATGHLIVTVSGTVTVAGTVSISGTVPVSGTFWQATQPVSIASTVAVDQAPPTSVATGQTSVAVTNTAVQLAANALGLGMVTIYANAANAAAVAIGGSTVTTANGLILAAGKAAIIAVDNTNRLYVNGTAGDGISWIAS